MFLSQRYFQFFEFFHFTFLRISLATKHRFPNREKLVNREIETVVLMYINPINSKKSVTSFSWIFHFWLIDFSKKIFEIKKSFRHQPWSFSLTSLHSQSKNLITEATKRSYRVDLSTIRPLYKDQILKSEIDVLLGWPLF